MPSLAPSTAARSQPMRPVRCRSRWTLLGIGVSRQAAVASFPAALVEVPKTSDEAVVRYPTWCSDR